MKKNEHIKPLPEGEDPLEVAERENDTHPAHTESVAKTSQQPKKPKKAKADAHEKD